MLEKIKESKLKSIRLENFKSHDELIFNVKQLNEIYGENRVGKSSVIQALQFCLFPSKSDVNKIKHGKEFAKVTVFFDIDEGKGFKEAIFSTKIKTDGSIYKKDTYNNILLKRVAKVRSSLVSFGTFNPRELLEKGNRTKYLLKILPLKIEKGELLELLNRINEESDIFDDDELYNKNKFDILKEFEDHVRNIRHSKGLVKEERKKSYQKRMKDHQVFVTEYKNKHGEVIEDLKSAKEKVYGSSSEYKVIKEERDKAQEKRDSLKDDIEKSNQLLIDLEKQKIEYEEKVNSIKVRIKDGKNVIRKQKEDLDSIDKDLKNKNMKLDTHDKERREQESLEGKIQWCEQIETQKGQLKEENIGLEEALKDWELYDNFIKIDFNQYKTDKIAECLQKIKKLEYRDGEFYFNKSHIEELSESEIIELGTKIACQDIKGANFLAIDCAEALDDDISRSIGRIAKNNNKKLILIRVAKEPLNEDFNSLHIKKENK